MVRPAPGGKCYHIETEIIAVISRVAGHEPFGGPDDARDIDRFERGGEGERIGARAMLDLNYDDGPALASDQIDLADLCLEAKMQDAVALETQIPRSDRLGPTSGPFGTFAPISSGLCA